ncbi:MAG: (d)CMP kinase [Ignavibacteria bacterium]
MYIVTIDGASGTGKSMTAFYLAKKLSFQYIDSGAFYRALTLLALERNIAFDNIPQIVGLLRNIDLTYEDDRILLKGRDISNDIRTLEVTTKVSNVSVIPAIRKEINAKLRLKASGGNLVIDGKDMGLSVFPEAQFKFYLLCDMSTRIARRQQEFLDAGYNIAPERIKLELEKRDEYDRNIFGAFILKAPDAIEIDTTHMIVEEQVGIMYRHITEKINPVLLT